MNLVFDPLMPWPAWSLVGFMLFLGMAWTGWRSSTSLRFWPRIGLLGIRMIALLGIWLLACRPSQEKVIEQLNHQRQVLILADQSLSMQQQDTPAGGRWLQVVQALQQSNVFELLKGKQLQPVFMAIDSSAHALNIEQYTANLPRGENTLLGPSIERALYQNPGVIKSVLLLSDGHDFSNASLHKTALLINERRSSLYTFGVGISDRARDVSIGLSSHLSYLHVEQEGCLKAILKTQGAEYEKIEVKLYREGKVVQSQMIETEERRETPLQFFIQEKEPGQVEYGLEAVPLKGEQQLHNNKVYSFVDINLKKIRVLVLEGEPHWDTTFMERVLMMNDKFDVDTMINYAPDQVRRIRKSKTEELQIPTSRKDFSEYDIVILGKAVHSMMTRQSLEGLKDFLHLDGGVLVFARPSEDGELPEALQELHPAVMGEEGIGPVSLKGEGEAGKWLAFQEQAQLEENPEVPRLSANHKASALKRLVSILSQASDGSENGVAPSILHRRMGKGQVLAINVDGLWKWGFHRMLEDEHHVLAQFWDQALVWLVAGGQSLPVHTERLHLDHANIPVGQVLMIRYRMKGTLKSGQSVRCQIFQEGKSLESIEGQISAEGMLQFSYSPKTEGRYEAKVIMEDGLEKSARFVAFQEQRESLEVMPDFGYLKRLAESCGGELLKNAHDLQQWASNIPEEVRSKTSTELKSWWDHPIVLLSLLGLLVLEWALRRRWGLW